jgi:hypothetical protein
VWTLTASTNNYTRRQKKTGGETRHLVAYIPYVACRARKSDTVFILDLLKMESLFYQTNQSYMK